MASDFDDWRNQHQQRLQERRRQAQAAETNRKETKKRTVDDLVSRYWGGDDPPPPPPSNAAPPAGDPASQPAAAPAPAPAATEDLAAMTQALAPTVTVRDLKGGGDPSLLYIQIGTTLLTASQYLTEHRIGLVLVVDGEGALAGVLSERDIVRAIGTQGPDILTKAVDDFVTEDVLTCRSNDKVADVARIMSQRKFRHMPIVDDGVLQGMISATDIVTHMAGGGTPG